MISPYLSKPCRSYGAALQERVEQAGREDRTDHKAEQELARINGRIYRRMAARRLAEREAANSPWPQER